MSDSLIHSVAGAAGGIVAMTVTYPLVFLSTRAAVETKNEQKSTKQAILDIVKREGLSGLYSGLNSSLVGIAVTNGVYYYFYERSRAAVVNSRPGSKALSTIESMLVGLIAGSITTTLVNPLWVIQANQATRGMGSGDNAGESSKKMGMVETVQHLIRKDGLTALWRGLGPALVLVMNPIIQYTTFEQLKNVLIKKRTQKLRAAGGAVTAVAVLSDWDFFLLGALSKLMATGSTYPYIVMKARLQAGHANAQKYKSSLDGLLTIIREEGIAGLYKGVGNKLLQSVLTAALLFWQQRRIYEMTKKATARFVKK